MVVSLSGCSPQEESDSTPPDPIIKLEKSQGKYRFGVTDTIAIDFSEPIDTSSLAIAIAPDQGVGRKFQGRTHLLIFGTNKTSGASHFTIKSPFSLTLAGLKDDAGNGQSEISEAFQPYPWVDRDFVDSSFTGFDSLFTVDSTWVDGSAMTDTVVTEGRLDFNSNFGKEDRQDIKVIRLVPPDTLLLALTCSKSLNMKIQIAGPFAENGLDTALLHYNFATSFHSDSTKSKGIVAYKFDADFAKHFDALGSPAAPGIYAIRLSIPVDAEGFYRLGMRLIKRKK
ncbi:MAG: hypothetical protein JWO30_2594 [Fibrobacteres bacterium]|nr:hypothetical protein [Fibrobacterota bacterium]